MQGLERSRGANRLTALEVKKATGPAVLEDGAGLRLFINDAGQKHWIVRVTINGKRVARGLGSFPAVSLQAARDRADVIRKAARNGQDAATEVKREQVRQAMTFRDGCKRYFEEVKRPTLKPGRFAERWIESLEVYAYPKLEDRPIADITPAEIIEILQPIWHSKRETATRVLQRMTLVFQSAIVRGDRLHANPCQGVRDELGKARPKVQHRRALPYAEVPAFAASLSDRPRATLASKLALLFVIYTACRSEEVRGARWSEIDAEAREWTVPADRMKMGREHIVPLSDGAMTVLEQAKALREDGCDLVFPSSVGRMLSDNTLSKLMRDDGVDGTPHGFRTSFKVWASENGIRDEVSEAVLAHGDPNKVRAAYRRTTFLDDRRRAMAEWSALVGAAAAACPSPAISS
ncbi:MAG: tyrosine-type recombinase/integrase [Hyphomicrobium zavarzinii]|uniref:tyrosine-type recombinase/integrase n=1 Tax=Hyphomicrobium zavarzinii TaxID=48292 RepID=UPI001A4D0C03|nr:site-specific integrase [Hyphomicrobium zavarzinii]MBL8845615.1 tyrosine-type recombinase/integrase [Hyphomicrobium zavarzinii]